MCTILSACLPLFLHGSGSGSCSCACSCPGFGLWCNVSRCGTTRMRGGRVLISLPVYPFDMSGVPAWRLRHDLPVPLFDERILFFSFTFLVNNWCSLKVTLLYKKGMWLVVQCIGVRACCWIMWFTLISKTGQVKFGAGKVVQRRPLLDGCRHYTDISVGKECSTLKTSHII